MYHSVRECKSRLVIEIITGTIISFSDSVGRLQKTMPYKKTSEEEAVVRVRHRAPTNTIYVRKSWRARPAAYYISRFSMQGSGPGERSWRREWHQGVQNKAQNTKKNTHTRGQGSEKQSPGIEQPMVHTWPSGGTAYVPPYKGTELFFGDGH